MSAASHCKMILADLKAGKRITQMQAIYRYGCGRLSARVYDLRREGHQIITDMIDTPNGARVAEYRMGAMHERT